MDSEFTWIPFYMEFADKLREYKDRRSDLVELINKVFENARFENPNINLPKLEKDRKVFDIDPFTVFGLFNKGIADAKRITIAA
ncbi:MAG: GTPase, partial [Clostridia bacterium]|nr:GTPase [Clostridia bacterium]